MSEDLERHFKPSYGGIFMERFGPVGEGLRQCGGMLAVAARLGEQKPLGLDRLQGGGRVGPGGFDNGESACRPERLDQFRRRRQSGQIK